MKFASKQNFKLSKSMMETPRGKSATVPDDSYTIQELVQKYTKGIDPMVSRAGVYEEEPDFDDIDLQELDRADLVDKMAAFQEAREVQAQEADRREKARKQPKKGEKGETPPPKDTGNPGQEDE